MARHSPSSTRRRFSLITVDQVLSGGSNVLIAILAARLLDAASFGEFGVVVLTYTLALCTSRALISDPVLIHPAEARERLIDVVGSMFVVGAGLGLLLLYVGGFVRLALPELGSSLVVLGLCMPLLALQDLGRYIGFALKTPGDAVALDAVWVVLQVAGITALFVTGTKSLLWLVVVWAGSGAMAAVLLPMQRRLGAARPDAAWLREMWGYSWRYLLSYGVNQGSGLASLVAVGGFAGRAQMGGLQGTLLLVRPFGLVQTAALAAGTSHTAHLAADGVRSSVSQLRRFATSLSLVAGAVAAVNAVILIVLPDRIGRLVLGDTWATAAPLLLPTGLQIVLLGLMTGMRAGLLGAKAIGTAVVIDVVNTVLLLIAIVLGAWVNGALGALWAACVAQGLVTAAWWAAYWRFSGTSARTA